METDDYRARNAATQEQLRTLLRCLSEEDLSRPLASGWTVSVVLAHLAFWDRQALEALSDWEAGGSMGRPADWDTVNARELPAWQAMPPRTAAREAIAAAAAVDEKIAGLSPEVSRAIRSAGRVRALDRSIHRREHLEDIADVVGR